MKMKDERRWEEMEMDCLVQIFLRLGLEDVTSALPFVCRSWHNTVSCNPILYRVFDFHDFDFMPWSNFAKTFSDRHGVRRFSFSGFMKFCVARSDGTAFELTLPPLVSVSCQDLDYISIECPRLRKLVIPKLQSSDEPRLPEIVGRLHDLEWLEMGSKPSSFIEIATEIGLNCKNFLGLKMVGSIKKEEALAIVNCLPKMKRLCLDKSYLPKEELLVIVNGCKDLEGLSVKNCVGFEANDEEIFKKAKKIKKFEHEGSKLVLEELDLEMEQLDSKYVDVM